MRFKKITLITCVTPLLLGGCTKESDKQIFISNYHYLESALPDEKDRFLNATSKNFNELLSLNLNFLVYFHKPECYWCDQFEPIINEYVSKHETLVVNVEYDNFYSFMDEFKNLFDIGDTFNFPYLGIMNGKKTCEKISNDQYMQTSKAFTNYMESKVKKTHIYYADVNYSNVKNNRKITCISLKSKDETAVNLYNQKVYNPMTQSATDILISCHNESNLELLAIDENGTIKEKTHVTSETESSTIERYF